MVLLFIHHDLMKLRLGISSIGISAYLGNSNVKYGISGLETAQARCLLALSLVNVVKVLDASI